MRADLAALARLHLRPAAKGAGRQRQPEQNALRTSDVHLRDVRAYAAAICKPRRWKESPDRVDDAG